MEDQPNQESTPPDADAVPQTEAQDAKSAEDGKTQTETVSPLDVGDISNGLETLEDLRTRLNNWMDESVRKQVPAPSLNALPDFSTATPMVLAEHLGKFGGYIGFLQGVYGRLESHEIIVKEALNSQLRLTKARLNLPPKFTDKAVEAVAYNDSTRLVELKHTVTVIVACGTEVRALIDAWKTLWDTVSRVVTVSRIEADAAGSARI